MSYGSAVLRIYSTSRKRKLRHSPLSKNILREVRRKDWQQRKRRALNLPAPSPPLLTKHFAVVARYCGSCSCEFPAHFGG